MVQQCARSNKTPLHNPLMLSTPWHPGQQNGPITRALWGEIATDEQHAKVLVGASQFQLSRTISHATGATTGAPLEDNLLTALSVSGGRERRPNSNRAARRCAHDTDIGDIVKLPFYPPLFLLYPLDRISVLITRIRGSFFAVVVVHPRLEFRVLSGRVLCTTLITN